MKKVIGIVLIVLFAFIVFANESKTTIERNLSEHGVLFLKLFKNLQEIKGFYDSKIKLTAIYLYDLSNDIVTKGVRISYKEEGEYLDRESSVYLDYEEIKELAKTLPVLKEQYFSYKGKVNDSFEIRYSFDEDLSFTLYTFYKKDNVSMKVGLYTCFFRIDVLKEIENQLYEAILWLDTTVID